MIGALNIIIPYIFAFLVSTIFFINKKKKVSICVCGLLVFISSIYLLKKNIETIENNNFFLPMFNQSINFNMSKADVINILNMNNYDFIIIEEHDDIVGIRSEWLGFKKAYLMFNFDEQNKLSIVSWGNIDPSNTYISQEEFVSLGDNALNYLDNCYGKRKYSESDMSYYWDNTTHYKVTLIYGTDYFLLMWHDPEIQPISVDINLIR